MAAFSITSFADVTSGSYLFIISGGSRVCVSFVFEFQNSTFTARTTLMSRSLQVLGVLLSLAWTSLRIRGSVLPSHATQDIFPKFDDIRAMAELVFSHCSHSIRPFHECDHRPGQIITHNDV